MKQDLRRDYHISDDEMLQFVKIKMWYFAEDANDFRYLLPAKEYKEEEDTGAGNPTQP